MENELVLFRDGELELQVNVEIEKDTVWLTANQMAILFEKDEKTVRKHINNIFADEELERENNTQKMRVVGVKQKVLFYSLDVIISVMIAESKPEEKETMVKLVMNFLKGC